MVDTSEDVLKRMEIGAVFSVDPPCRINSVDYFSSGDHLVATSDDGTLMLFDTVGGKQSRKLFLRKYGMANVNFTHHQTAVVGSSTMSHYDCSIRYLSLHENAYLREYRGHNEMITSLTVSPKDDTMLSASFDNTIRQWDLRMNNCLAVLKKQGPHHVCYDPTGDYFCSATNSKYIKFYDFRNLDKGPFTTFELNATDSYSSIQFSNDRKQLLVTTQGPQAFVVDVGTGQARTLTVPNVERCLVGGCFSPDGKYVLVGSQEGKIHVWSTDPNQSREVRVMGGHAGPVGCLKWNPKYNSFVSTCTNTALWLPNFEKILMD